MKARKYSRVNIKSAPKTARQYKSSVNKILWRKYHLRREDVGVSVDALAAAFAEGKTADTLVRELVASL